MRNRLLITIGIVALVGVVLYLVGFRMTKADLHISAAAEPLFCLSGTIDGEHCVGALPIPFTNSLLMTIIVDAILLGIAFTTFRNPKLIPVGIQNTVETIIEFFYDFARGVDRKNVAKFFPLPATIFCFFLVANMLALVPMVGSVGICRAEGHTEEPVATESAAAVNTETVNPFFTGWPGACYDHQLMVPLFRAPAADLNVTLAFALVAGIMIEVMGFQALGLGYLGKFFINPLKEGFLQTLVGLLELLGEFTRIVAFTFRIFGNIFGGEVVLVVMAYLFPYILPLPFYGLEIFVSFIQAVIFSVLTLVFFSIAVQSHGGHDDHSNTDPAHPVEGAGSPAH